MASYEKAMPLGGPLPKFGDWDVNNPASAEGFTVIFNKARDDRRSSAGTPLILAAPDKYDARKKKDNQKEQMALLWLRQQTHDAFGGCF